MTVSTGCMTCSIGRVTVPISGMTVSVGLVTFRVFTPSFAVFSISNKDEPSKSVVDPIPPWPRRLVGIPVDDRYHQSE